MVKLARPLILVPAAVLSLTIGCSSTDSPVSPGFGNGGSSAAGSNSQAGSTSNAGANNGGSTSNAGAGGMSGGGAGGASGSTGIAGSGGAGGAGGGSAGSGAGGGTGMHVRTGMSAGCNKPPPGTDSSKNYALHEVHMTGIDPIYLKGGKLYDPSGPYDASFRPYSVRLPTNYDPSKPYAVTFGGGGCGGSATGFASGPSGGLQMAPNGTTLQVGLSYLTGCFSDGGPSIDNRPDTPEEPYFRAVMADLEKNYCFDLSKVFVAGSSSGAWESYTLGCAAADLIRGIGTDEGGMRNVRPMCKGPAAAVLVAGLADTENPIGPLDPVADKGAVDRLGSFGSAPGRDDLLKRNGCTSSMTTPYVAPAGGKAYEACVQYKDCPAAYPVIWCALPGIGHNSSTYNNVDYSPGPMWDILGALPPPT